MNDTPKPPNSQARDEMIIALHQLNGGVIAKADTALRLAEVLFEAHLTKQDFEQQKPLTVTDMGTHWRIEGSRNRDGSAVGSGPFGMSIEKADGRITDFSGVYHIKADPDVARFYAEHFRKTEPDSKK